MRFVRRFFLTASIDGIKTKIATGPRRLDGAGCINIALRNNGEVEQNAITITIGPATRSPYLDPATAPTRLLLTYTDDDGVRQSITLNRSM